MGNVSYLLESNMPYDTDNKPSNAKGLLSQMLSLPDEWNYSLKGLAHINRENVSAIRTAVNELENAAGLTSIKAWTQGL